MMRSNRPTLRLALVAAATCVALGTAAGTATAHDAAAVGPSYACAFYQGSALTQYGDTGDRVSQVQCLLTQWHYLALKDIDGIFGNRTDSAVRAFQRAHHLQVDGQVGTHTWAALRGH